VDERRVRAQQPEFDYLPQGADNSGTAANLTIVASHDDEERRRLIDSKILGGRLE